MTSLAELLGIKKKSEVSYNAVFQDTTTITTEYYKDFPQGYYYYGFMINSSSVDITFAILKQDGYTIGPLTMEPNTRLVVAGLDIQKLVVNVVPTTISFRFNFFGSTQPPLPGTESLDIVSYVIQTSSVISLETETLPFTVSQNGTVYLQLVGTGVAASVSFDNGTTYDTLNGGAVLASGALYEFEIHVADGDVIQVENATVRQVFYEA